MSECGRVTCMIDIGQGWRVDSPVDQHVATAQSGGVDEVVAQGEVLREVLVRGVRRHHAQIVFVL